MSKDARRAVASPGVFTSAPSRLSDRHNARPLHLEHLEDRYLLSAVPQMVLDIGRDPASSHPYEFVEVSGTIFFGARNGHGVELWKTNGTPSGTFFVKDIFPGADLRGDAFSSGPRELTNVNGTLFFVATNHEGTGIYRSDGTAEGTTRVTLTLLGPYGASARSLLNFNGNLYFVAPTGQDYDADLWRIDPSRSNPVIVKSLGRNSWGSGDPVIIGGTLFFAAEDAAGRELWRTDGTESGTVRVKDIDVGPSGSYPEDLIRANGTLYFMASEDDGTRQLWKSDGTEAGTVQVSEITWGDLEYEGHLFAFGDRAAFWTQRHIDDDSDWELSLWTSNGSIGGTAIVKTFSAPSVPEYYPAAEHNGELFFIIPDSAAGVGLWKTNGTPAGTIQVKSLHSEADSYYFPTRSMLNVAGTLYFDAGNRETGAELWLSDGTKAGTQIVEDLRLGPKSAEPRDLTNIGGTLYFCANDGIAGAELWRTADSPSALVLVSDSEPDSYDGPDLSELFPLGNTLFFAHNDGATGTELWRTGGTAESTRRVKDLDPGPAGSSPRSFVELNGALFFLAYVDGGAGLWRSDGTEDGTVLVRSVDSGVSLTKVGDTLFFFSYGHVYGLWKSDGTTDGTVQVKSGLWGRDNSEETLEFQGQLYFAADDGVHGRELWRSDGTEAGTFMVRDLRPGSESSHPSHLEHQNGTLLFYANPSHSADGWGIFRSDGTEAGTVPHDGFPPYRGVDLGSSVFFISENYNSRRELYRWNETLGLMRVKEIGIGYPYNTDPHELINVNGTLYFMADTGIGDELWKSDGTEAGTVHVKDIQPHTLSDSQTPRYLTNVRGTLYFVANDGDQGYELWRSDGTNAGTIMVADINAQPRWTAYGALPGDNSWPRHLTVFGDRLYFTASDGIHGRELWSLQLGPEERVAGDFTHDGLVDGADLLVWQRGLGLKVVPTGGADGNGDGVVDAADLAIWQSRYNALTLPRNGSAASFRPARRVDYTADSDNSLPAGSVLSADLFDAPESAHSQGTLVAKQRTQYAYRPETRDAAFTAPTLRARPAERPGTFVAADVPRDEIPAIVDDLFAAWGL